MKQHNTAIVLDIDGCLAEFNKPFAHELLKGTDIDPATVKFAQWYWYKDYPISAKQVEDTWHQIVDVDQSFWMQLPILPGAQALLNDCVNLGMEVHFVTARGTKLYDVTHDWLSQFIRAPRLCMTERKGLYCAAVDAKYFLDDRPENCQNVLHIRGTETLPFLVDAEWNRKFTHTYVRRIKHLAELSEVLYREQR